MGAKGPTFFVAAASLESQHYLAGGTNNQEPTTPSPNTLAAGQQGHDGKQEEKKKAGNKIQKFIGNLVDLAVSTLSSVASVSGASLESDRATRQGDSSDLLTDCPGTFEQASQAGAVPICRVQIGVASERQLPVTSKASAAQHEGRDGHGEAKVEAGHAAEAVDECGQDMHSGSGTAGSEAELLPVLYFAMNYYALISQPVEQGSTVEAAGQLQLAGSAGPDAEAEQRAEEQQKQRQKQQQQPARAPAAPAPAPTVSWFSPASKHTGRGAPESAVSGFFFRPSASLAEVLETPPHQEQQPPHGLGRAASTLTTASSAASSTLAPAAQLAAGRHGGDSAFMRESVSLEELLAPPWRPREEDCWRAPSGGLPAAEESAFGRTSFPAAAAFPSAWPSP